MPRTSAGRADLQNVASEFGTLRPRASYTTAYSSGILVNGGGQQLIVTLVSWTIGTASLTVSIKEVTPVTFVATDLLVSAAIITNTTTRLRLSPHLTAAVNTIGKEIVPALFQITVAVAGAQSAEYELHYQLVP